RLDVAPPARADDAKLAAVESGLLKALDETAEILSRLERRDREYVIALGGVAGGRERRPDGVRDHPDLRFRDPEQVDELASSELGDRNHALCGPRDAREQCPAVPPRPGVERLRVPQDGEVVKRYDQGHRGANRSAKAR